MHSTLTHSSTPTLTSSYQNIDPPHPQPTNDLTPPPTTSPATPPTTTTTSSTKPPNKFTHLARKIYHPLGFKKGYNFTLFFIFAGALFGFVLARLQYLNYANVYLRDAAPGEAYYTSGGHYRVGLFLHLITILPASLLVILQFVPAVRHRWIRLHRVNGYVIILLLLTSVAGALMIARRAFGGTLETQAGIGLLAIITTGGLGMAWWNIRCLQIDQHRAWMLRTYVFPPLFPFRFSSLPADPHRPVHPPTSPQLPTNSNPHPECSQCPPSSPCA